MDVLSRPRPCRRANRGAYRTWGELNLNRDTSFSKKEISRKLKWDLRKQHVGHGIIYYSSAKKIRVRIFLNDQLKPEIDSSINTQFPKHFGQLFFGGRSDSSSGWEGRLDELAIYGRALTEKEIKQLLSRN